MFKETTLQFTRVMLVDATGCNEYDNGGLNKLVFHKRDAGGDQKLKIS